MRIEERHKSSTTLKLLNSYTFQRSLHDFHPNVESPIRKRKIIYIHGNCQSRAIEEILSEIPEIRKNFLVVSNPIQNLDFKHLPSALSSIVKADFFIYQPVKDNFRNTSKLGSEYLKTLLKDSCKAISFPSLFFEGYFPEQIHLKDLNGNEIRTLNSPYHDFNILRFYLNGYPPHKVLSLIQKEDFYEESYIVNYFSSSLNELEKREYSSDISINVSDIIRQRHKEKKLFYTVNHPSRDMFLFLVKEILLRCEIDIEIPENGCDPISNFNYPLYPSLYKTLKCSFSNSGEYRIQKHIFSPLEYIENIFKEYDSLDIDWKQIISSERTRKILNRKGINDDIF